MKTLEITFVLEKSPEGGYMARALGESIFTEGDSLEQLKANIKEAVLTHFEDNQNIHISYQPLANS